MVSLQQTIDGEAAFKKFTEPYKNMNYHSRKVCQIMQFAPFRPRSNVQLLAMPKAAAGKENTLKKFFGIWQKAWK